MAASSTSVLSSWKGFCLRIQRRWWNVFLFTGTLVISTKPVCPGHKFWIVWNFLWKNQGCKAGPWISDSYLDQMRHSWFWLTLSLLSSNITFGCYLVVLFWIQWFKKKKDRESEGKELWVSLRCRTRLLLCAFPLDFHVVVDLWLPVEMPGSVV